MRAVYGFFDKSCSKYDDEDVRLSHVGTYVEPNGNTHLILCILSTEDDGESFVNK